MREGCKSSGASEARGSGAGERRCGGDNEADRRGPRGGDRRRRRRRRAAQTRRRDDFWQIRQGRTCRDGPSARAACLRKAGVGWAGWAERPDGPVGRWADCAESEGKNLFRIKFDF
jgi:hypothetical protein